MKYTEAIIRRDQEHSLLVNTPFNKLSDWFVKDVIVASHSTIADLYIRMWNSSISNEEALKLVAISEDEYEVFVISHQWPWGSGNLLYERIESYRKANPS